MVERDSRAVDLAEAIKALRDALVQAWWDGQQQQLRFKLEPIELTLHVGVTQASKGAAGVAWHLLTLGGERSRQAETIQTLTLRLTPVLFDARGQALAEDDQLVSDTE